jgi:Zn-dependent M32 family carboxypeptidase
MEMSLEYDWQILSLDSMPFMTACQNDLPMRVTYDFEVSDFHRLRVTTLHGAYHEVCIGLCALS